MVEAFNQNFSVTKTQSCTEFSRIWHSILWEYLLFKLPKEIKVAKGNISVHYKTSLTIIHLDLMSYCNMDGKHKTTDTIKKRRLEAPKCAQPLSVRSNFSLEVSLCSKSQVFFSWQTTYYINKRGLGWVSELMIHVDSKLTENRICKIMSTILKNNLQIQPWFEKVIVVNQILIYLNVSVFYLYSQCSRQKFYFLFQLSSYTAKKVFFNISLAINMASQYFYCQFPLLILYFSFVIPK